MTTATNPFTQITKDPNIWSSEIKAKLTDEMIDLINKSPTLQIELNHQQLLGKF